MYSLAVVASLDHDKNPYRRKRKQTHPAEQPAPSPADASPICLLSDDDTSDDSEATMDYDLDLDLPAVPAHASPIPVADGIERDHVPDTLANLWREVYNNSKSRKLAKGMCVNGKCVYCAGPLMTQRYMLVQRLMQLETKLFGDHI